MSSLMWPWPERMVSGLKPTKSSWLAVVQIKAPQPSCLSWMVLILMSRKQKRKRQTGHVSGCPKLVLWMRQLKRGAGFGLVQISFPNNALVIFANHVLDTFLQIVVPDYLYANLANCCSVQPFCNLSFSTIYFLQNVANVLFLTLHLKFGSKLSMGLYGAFWAPCDTKQSYAIRGLRHGPICCCSVSMVFWAPSGTKQSYAILGLRHDPICCCSLSVVWLKLWQNIFRYFGWAKFWRKGMIVKAS